VALSMDEQRILDEMERRLAGDDPKLASRLALFGQPSMLPVLRSPRARLIISVLSLAMIALVAVLMYSVSPFRSAGRTAPDHTRPAVPAASHQPAAGSP
jgi:DUF3040 family protein